MSSGASEKKDKCRRPKTQHLVTKTWLPGFYYETCDCDEGDEETASQGFTATGDAATPVLIIFLIGCGGDGRVARWGRQRSGSINFSLGEYNTDFSRREKSD